MGGKNGHRGSPILPVTERRRVLDSVPERWRYVRRRQPVDRYPPQPAPAVPRTELAKVNQIVVAAREELGELVAG
jgi:hypothetical protein